MSLIYYKFKSAKDFDSVTFDGLSLSVFDLKRDIIEAKKLKGDFDILLYNAQTNEEYSDDSFMLPRNTSILVSRAPPSKPGRGNASRYITGGPSSTTSGGSGQYGGGRHFNERPSRTAMAAAASVPTASDPGLSNLFKQQAEQWAHNQGNMSSRPAFGNRVPYDPNRPVPEGYICFRCGQKGHYIANCPTLGNVAFDKPHLKRTTGIPKSFLKAVSDRNDADTGVMLSFDGTFVIQKTNDQAWQKVSSVIGSSAENILSSAPVPAHMQCAICKQLARDAVKSPCCASIFCDDCIRNQLLDPVDEGKRLSCPSCGKYLAPESLIVQVELRAEIRQHLQALTDKRLSGKETAESATDIARSGVTSSSSTPAPEELKKKVDSDSIAGLKEESAVNDDSKNVPTGRDSSTSTGIAEGEGGGAVRSESNRSHRTEPYSKSARGPDRHNLPPPPPHLFYPTNGYYPPPPLGYPTYPMYPPHFAPPMQGGGSSYPPYPPPRDDMQYAPPPPFYPAPYQQEQPYPRPPPPPPTHTDHFPAREDRHLRSDKDREDSRHSRPRRSSAEYRDRSPPRSDERSRYRHDSQEKSHSRRRRH